ncbi:MAG: transglycosylase SLT domain-containing protein [Myxococcota bacterium]|nr:transglycosylase SLT domain-containing protein [Myxococcota bacterium]
MAKALQLLLAGVVWATLGASQAGAQAFYRYVDAEGRVHLSDRPQPGWSQVAGPRGTRPPPRPIQRAAFRPGARTFDPLISRAAIRYGVPPAMIKAVIHAESAFNPDARSHKGAMGLMQLMPRTAESLGVGRPYNAGENVFGGTRYLSDLFERYQSWSHTLAAYNAGPSAVDRYGGIPPYAETRTYVRRVLSYYRRYHGDFSR